MRIKNRSILKLLGFIPKGVGQEVIVCMPLYLWVLYLFKNIFSPLTKKDYRL